MIEDHDYGVPFIPMRNKTGEVWNKAKPGVQ